ncbi:putative CRM domain-containing protein, chloroplastic isoform X1 [Iris pallida]|uniref:CRM domain-containing protein, chloroplastic isoform X1 n=1 Tax=Iris pallida TaxID=29817 RepID=A0AAX6GT77_IRIPA|nr:putative CRM domain-containing protein, chloroplastic isoform X1 [Iris pallida]
MGTHSLFWRKMRRINFSACLSTPLSSSIYFENRSSSLRIFVHSRCADVFCKFSSQNRLLSRHKSMHLMGCCSIHTNRQLRNTSNVMEPQTSTGDVSVDGNGNTKVKRKKLKGRRAVVKWLKSFRWKKKKEYERMTAEEKILYKLRKARRKEEQIIEALRKIEPPESSEATHDPEILTPEEHFYLLKMGHKSKNYVPVGRRGIFQGVILNMHLHWKKHQTLKVVVKTFTVEEVREIAAELARLSGGIVLDIHEENTIIMYRGKKLFAATN